MCAQITTTTIIDELPTFCELLNSRDIDELAGTLYAGVLCFIISIGLVIKRIIIASLVSVNFSLILTCETSCMNVMRGMEC